MEFILLKKIFAILLISYSQLSAFHSVMVNMNNEELETNINLDLAQFIDKFPVNHYFIGYNYLYIENNTYINTMQSVNLLMRNRLPNYRPITFTLGAKFISADMNNKQISAVPFGFSVKFELPINSLPISFYAQVFYSPKPLTFSDGDTYLEQKYELSFEVIEKGQIFIGYRDISSTLKQSDRVMEFSKIPYAGLRIGF